MLAPDWRHFRVGPYLRGERDKRAYHRLFHFPEYVTGLRRTYFLILSKKINAEDIDLARALRCSDRTLVVVFNNRVSGNEDNHFHEIVGRNDAVKNALLNMTRPQFLPKVTTQDYIAVHVRMGDFAVRPAIESLRGGLKNSRVPIEWYASMLDGLRRKLGETVPVRLFSDGADRDLTALLRRPAVERVRPLAAITDLLEISNASALISSGSGFSYWGSYLGSVPRICFPGQRHYRVLGAPSPIDCEPECESPAELSETFVELVQCRLNGGMKA